MSKWAKIRVKADADGLRRLSAKVERFPEEIFVNKYYNELQRIAWRARDYMKELILQDTNTKNYERFGKIGRVGKTGDLHKRIWARVVKQGKTDYRLDVGWLAGEPGYALFQEYGTRTGVRAMNTLPRVADFIAEEISKITSGGKTNINSSDWLE